MSSRRMMMMRTEIVTMSEPSFEASKPACMSAPVTKFAIDISENDTRSPLSICG